MIDVTEYVQDECYITSLIMSRCELLLPQSDVISVQSIYDIDTSRPHTMSVGSIKFRGRLLPVYALSSELTLLLKIPDKHAQCALVKYRDGEYFLLCEGVSNYQTNQISFHDLPVCMKTDTMPLTHLALYKLGDNTEQLGMMTNGDALYYSLLNQLEVRHE